ncbi:MAG: DNA topoisomerase IV subunit A [Candidatus Bathyarchaeota archaeon]|nr:DNA topoisomerase IV subunit A [Candidatus Bathyarchaeota archaeon]MCZ2845599.1 DNA topoisomerase IV subunit A [Candidatus Bathyarchaeota archaeon]
MRNKKSESSIKKKKEIIIQTLQNFGLQIYDQLWNCEFPWTKMPSRSINNIFYDSNLRQYILGDKAVKRSATNIRHIRPLTQMIWTALFANELSTQKKTSTLRDVFYSAQAYEMSFKDQQESDNIITDLETVIGHSREDFNVFPEERSAIFGDLTIEYTLPGYEGRRLNLTSHPDGMMIGPALTNAEFADCKADKVIAIEKGGLFTRFVEERVHDKFKAILVHTAGQAPRATRDILRRLNQELELPVYIFTDGDPWGMHIAMVIISGSANAAHLRDLNTPDAKWSGVWASDIVEYKLPSDKLTELDIKRLHELRKDPRYRGKLWKKEIKTFLNIKKKAEQEAFSRYGLTYIVDEYLPTKLEAMEE